MRSYTSSFTTVIRDAYNGRGVSFNQVARLIESIGHVGNIDDFTIKPMEQHSFLVTGFSRHVSSRPTFGGTTLSTTAEAGRDHVNAKRTRPQQGRAVDAGALASRRSEPSSSDDDSGLSDSDSESSNDEDELGCSGTRMNVPWEDLDEQRLRTWKTRGQALGLDLQEVPWQDSGRSTHTLDHGTAPS
jgi:hypothetical protein